jgi:hypothetical protein
MRFALAIVAALIWLSPTAGAKDPAPAPRQRDVFDILMPTSVVQESCGLQKLTVVERTSLARQVSRLIPDTRMADSAVAYLKSEEDFEEVIYKGTKRMRIDPLDKDEDPETYHIFEEGPWTYICEDLSFSLLQPGRYLGKMSIATCEVLDYDGDLVSFWTKDQR